LFTLKLKTRRTTKAATLFWIMGQSRLLGYLSVLTPVWVSNHNIEINLAKS